MAVERVVAGVAGDHVVAVAATEGVVPRAAVDAIVPCLAVELIVTSAAVDVVISRAAVDDVVATLTINRVIAAERGNLVVAAEQGLRGDVGIVGGRIEVVTPDLVVAAYRAAIDAVRTLSTDQQIVAIEDSRAGILLILLMQREPGCLPLGTLPDHFPIQIHDPGKVGLNSHPKTLANLSGKTKVSFDDLQRHGFDVHRKMGTILKERRNEVSFRSLEDICDAYGLAFSEQGKAIEGILREPSLRHAAGLRNLLVHKAGIIDDEFLRQIRDMPGDQGLAVGSEFLVNGELCACLTSACRFSGIRLFLAVHAWIIGHPEKSGGCRMERDRESGLGTTLEVRCDNCDGMGGRFVEGCGGWHRCRRCNGAGFVPTELGEKILALFRHNFKPMLDDYSANHLGERAS